MLYHGECSLFTLEKWVFYCWVDCSVYICLVQLVYNFVQILCALIDFLIVLYIIESWSTDVLYYYCRAVFFPLNSVRVLHFLWRSNVSVYMFVIVSLLWSDPLYKCLSLCLISTCDLKSVLSGISKAIPALFFFFLLFL